MEMSTTKRVLLLLYPGWYFHYKKGGHIIVTGAQLLLVYSIVDMTIIIIIIYIISMEVSYHLYHRYPFNDVFLDHRYLVFQIHLVGGLEHEFHFPQYMGCHPSH